MTAITLTAPARHAGGAASCRRTSGQGPGQLAPSRPQPSVVAAVRRAPMRLTRRGRLAATGLMAAVTIGASMFVGGVSLAGSRAEHAPVRYVTVLPGQTLWAIAGEVAPEADRRDTVARILELNALPTSALQAGQRIAVPQR